jgi:hypothetical protein
MSFLEELGKNAPLRNDVYREKGCGANPLYISFFSAVGVMFDTNGIAYLVKELFGWRLHRLSSGL